MVLEWARTTVGYKGEVGGTGHCRTVKEPREASRLAKSAAVSVSASFWFRAQTTAYKREGAPVDMLDLLLCMIFKARWFATGKSSVSD